jgi:hypothetical protein
MLARVIDISGVTPDPADRYSDFAAGAAVGVKAPEGPYAR